MVASNKTVESVGRVLIAEVGLEKAFVIAVRLNLETTGNRSFQQTMKNLEDWLGSQKKNITPSLWPKGRND